MTRDELFQFIRRHRVAVLATVDVSIAPEAAIVGFAVTPSLELIFDTVDSTRKCGNLRGNPKIAFVIGLEDEVTLQYEGIADEPVGAELAACKAIYFEAYPDGPERERWPGITYFRVRPTWTRYSDYRMTPPTIIEQRYP